MPDSVDAVKRFTISIAERVIASGRRGSYADRMSQPLRGIVIGAGSRGADVYAPRLLEQPALGRIVAVAEPDPIRRRDFSRRYDVSDSACYADSEALLSQARLADYTIIATAGSTPCSTLRPRKISRVAALIACLLVAAACDLDSIGDAPAANCSESGVLCQLASGPLGVCERTQCGPDHSPPCFQCTPQH